MNKIFLAITISILFVGITNQAIAQEVDVNMIKISDPIVILETELGKIVIAFFPNDAPNHVKNFIILSQTGFYDGTLFHRIIPGFMIQGGDPNTIDGDPSTWGIGGPDERLDAEFNNIKHNRGIVSMARSADPNSGGSQFFIVHQDSNLLDGQYTVFGRIITDESFETLDKIASVSTTGPPKDNPLNPEQVRITKVSVVPRAEIPDLIELTEPERMKIPVEIEEFEKFDSEEYGFSMSFPTGWQFQEPSKSQKGAPDISIFGTKLGIIPPTFSITIEEESEKSFDEKISDLQEIVKKNTEQGNMVNVTQEKQKIRNYDAYVLEGVIPWKVGSNVHELQFKEVIISEGNNFYTLNYYNDKKYFYDLLPTFETSLDSFNLKSEVGGCLIATATFGSEMAPQVQKLRELRDNTILATESGTAFMGGFNQLYYSFSPTIADLERESPLFKEVVKLTITPMLSTLSILNYAEINSEEEMISYGVGIILMNIGMYFAAPVIVIYKIRKLN